MSLSFVLWNDSWLVILYIFVLLSSSSCYVSEIVPESISYCRLRASPSPLAKKKCKSQKEYFGWTCNFDSGSNWLDDESHSSVSFLSVCKYYRYAIEFKERCCWLMPNVLDLVLSRIYVMMPLKLATHVPLVSDCLVNPFWGRGISCWNLLTMVPVLNTLGLIGLFFLYCVIYVLAHSLSRILIHTWIIPKCTRLSCSLSQTSQY